MRSLGVGPAVVAAITLLTALPCMAEPPTPVFWAHGPESGRVSRIHEVLSEPLSERGLKFEGTHIQQVVAFLRDEYEIEVQLDLQALDDLGISPDDPIDVDLQRISLASALRIMLRQLDLTYIISDEVLLITSEEEALTRLTVAVYPVGDLLVRKGGGQGQTEAAATSSDDSTNNDEGDAKPTRPNGYNMDALINVIISNVVSDTWVQNGGPEAEIVPLQPGLLVISQTQDVHEQIANLLTAIRRSREHPFAIQHEFDPTVGTDPCRVLRQRAENAEALATYLRQAIQQRDDSRSEDVPPADNGGGGMF